jgi:hypothetical protein
VSPMQAQPEGTSRVRLDPPVTDTATGKPFPAKAFVIYYADPDYGKVRIGETHRVQEGKRRGDWEPRSVVPDSALKGSTLLLEPVPRHNDAMEYLRDLWIRAIERGWTPPDAQKPAEAPAEQAPEPTLAEALKASLGGESLPEMEGVPVVPAPPGIDPAQLVLPAVSRSDVATSQEHEEVIREIPAGHPDDPSTQNGTLLVSPDGLQEAALEEFEVPSPPATVLRPSWPVAVIPAADPQVQQAVVDADDWLNQPARPADPPAFPDGDFPLDFPGPLH